MTVFYAVHNDSQLDLARRVFLEPTVATLIDADVIDPYNPYDTVGRLFDGEDGDCECDECGYEGCDGCDDLDDCECDED